MKLGWGPRQVLVLLVLAATLIVISGLLELTTVVRLANESAATESGLISEMLIGQIGRLAQEVPGDIVSALRGDDHIPLILQAATAQSPSVVFVAICDTSGTILAHTDRERIGQRIDDFPSLPETRSLGQALGLLFRLSASPPVYGVETPLRRGNIPFASIQIGIAGGLLRDHVGAVFRHGILAALLQLGLAVAVGIVLSGLLRGRVRRLEDGVARFRAGRFATPIPEQGLEEFGDLVRNLNLIGLELERERREMDSGFRTTVDSLEDGIITLGPDREILLMNTRAEQFLRVRGPWLGRRLDEILSEDHPVRRLADSLYCKDTGCGDDPVGITVALPEDAAGALCAVLGRRISGHGGAGGVLIEIKETAALRKLEALVDRSRVLARLGQMAAGVAHEIRNPLQTINLELDLLRRAPGLGPDEVQEHICAATEEVQRLQRAVTGFLKVARLQRMPISTIAPAETVLEVVHSLETEASLAGFELTSELAPDLPEMLGDLDVLRQALADVVRNALEAQPSRDRRVVVRACTAEDEVLISVEDSGPGIRPEHLDRIFDLYFTTKEHATGIGLAFVRQAIELHSGRVEVHSRPGEGTVVTMRFPISLRRRSA